MKWLKRVKKELLKSRLGNHGKKESKVEEGKAKVHLFSPNPKTRQADYQAVAQKLKVGLEVKNRKLVEKKQSWWKRSKEIVLEHSRRRYMIWHWRGGRHSFYSWHKETQVKNIRAGKHNHTGRKHDGRTRTTPDFTIKQDVTKKAKR